MEQNKLTLENCCLTIEQAKELQALGVNMYSTIFSFTEVDDEKWKDIHLRTSEAAYEIKTDCDKVRIGGIIVVPTLTNSEMLDMLPTYVEYKDKIYNIDCNKDNRVWYIGYQRYNEQYLKTFNDSLLRDALFEMIKHLKINKNM